VDSSENRTDDQNGHCDTDTLITAALGHRIERDVDATHLQSCAACRSRADQFAAVVATARATEPADVPVGPPPAVWSNILGELGDEITPLEESSSGRVTRLRANVFSTGMVAAAASVVLVAAGFVAGALVFGGDDDTAGGVSAGGTPTAFATVALQPVGQSPDQGVAVMEATPGGTSLKVAVPATAQPPEGFYEVWLLDPASMSMVSLGALDDNGTGSFAMPPGVDLTRYPYIDISHEHDDGDPSHSGSSVVRGAIPA
jgi:hypothetical protein